MRILSNLRYDAMPMGSMVAVHRWPGRAIYRTVTDAAPEGDTGFAEGLDGNEEAPLDSWGNREGHHECKSRKGPRQLVQATWG
ncbi:hypothetical protein GCM10011584_17070 [Nocardioides phosphati]|uniref:Uncharacterized protein n=1 Tax=Nocardioides phosphati TaxID=1867775 RepID=A0ABQ2NA41_9ACTN|nr:hypothetical protein GCM10011584_17070 [Nocardioides phosphati]